MERDPARDQQVINVVDVNDELHPKQAPKRRHGATPTSAERSPRSRRVDTAPRPMMPPSQTDDQPKVVERRERIQHIVHASRIRSLGHRDDHAEWQRNQPCPYSRSPVSLGIPPQNVGRNREGDTPHRHRRPDDDEDIKTYWHRSESLPSVNSRSRPMTRPHLNRPAPRVRRGDSSRRQSDRGDQPVLDRRERDRDEPRGQDEREFRRPTRPRPDAQTSRASPTSTGTPRNVKH